jgi:GNAT superfamily N-acetyltransferase
MTVPEVKIVNTKLEYAEQMEAMQRLIFPTLTENELIHAEKYRHHVKLFPEGQLAAVIEQDGKEIVVGATSSFRIKEGPNELGQHTFEEIVSENWFHKHDPNGEWLYGADMSVHPDYRKMGIASKLYTARGDVVKKLNLRGEIAGGMLPGYDKHRSQYNIDEYVQAVARGELTDPTLTPQLRNGFELRGVLYGYITDPRSDNHSSLIVRPNPDYHPE